MENIKFQLDYKSQNKNGWPMIMIMINGIVIERFLADCGSWHGYCPTDILQSKNKLQIWHYGKNYNTDHGPDKFFELEKVYINGVDLKYHIHKFRQTAFLPPWDQTPPPTTSLYLGHEGYLELEFDSPVNQWIKNLFNVGESTMHGQQTTKAVLNDVKKFFDFN